MSNSEHLTPKVSIGTIRYMSRQRTAAEIQVTRDVIRRVNAVMDQRGVGIRQLERKAGITGLSRTLREGERQSIDVGRLSLIAKALDVSPAYLLEGQGTASDTFDDALASGLARSVAGADNLTEAARRRRLLGTEAFVRLHRSAVEMGALNTKSVENWEMILSASVKHDMSMFEREHAAKAGCEGRKLPTAEPAPKSKRSTGTHG